MRGSLCIPRGTCFDLTHLLRIHHWVLCGKGFRDLRQWSMRSQTLDLLLDVFLCRFGSLINFSWIFPVVLFTTLIRHTTELGSSHWDSFQSSNSCQVHGSKNSRVHFGWLRCHRKVFVIHVVVVSVHCHSSARRTFLGSWCHRTTRQRYMRLALSRVRVGIARHHWWWCIPTSVAFCFCHCATLMCDVNVNTKGLKSVGLTLKKAVI